MRSSSSALASSVKGFCDELVVVDTGSTDNTVAIAKDAGARVEEIEWPGDFTPARNKALEFVSGDWVLVLDADELLLDDVKPALQALMAQPDVLVINLLRYEDGAVQSPYSSVSRLFRKHPAIQWSRALSLDDRRLRRRAAQKRANGASLIALNRPCSTPATAPKSSSPATRPTVCGRPWSRARQQAW